MLTRALLSAALLIAGCGGGPSDTESVELEDGGPAAAAAAVSLPASVGGLTLSVRSLTGKDFCDCPDFPIGDGRFADILRRVGKTPDDVEEVRLVSPIVGDEFGWLDPKVETYQIDGTTEADLLGAARASGDGPDVSVADEVFGGLPTVVLRSGDTRFYYTAVHSTMVWVMTSRPAFVEALFAAINPAAPRPTTGPSPTPADLDPLPITVAGQASADGERTTELVQLAGGDYRLRWTVRAPFDPSDGICGVTVSMFDQAGEYAGGVAGPITVVERPTSGQADYRDLPPGRYEIAAYVGCPWEVVLDRP